jgi:hypothetical protein
MERERRDAPCEIRLEMLAIALRRRRAPIWRYAKPQGNVPSHGAEQSALVLNLGDDDECNNAAAQFAASG